MKEKKQQHVYNDKQKNEQTPKWNDKVGDGKTKPSIYKKQGNEQNPVNNDKLGNETKKIYFATKSKITTSEILRSVTGEYNLLVFLACGYRSLWLSKYQKTPIMLQLLNVKCR